MNSFTSFQRDMRKPASPMETVFDPAEWSAQELEDVLSWSYALTPSDITELLDGVKAFKNTALPIVDVSRDTFPLNHFARRMREVRQELLDGRGIVMLKGFPIDLLDREGTAIAYLGMGVYIGTPMTQNKFGHVLGHVKDLGANYADANTRGYMTSAELRFHSDGCDYVGLLCLKTSKAGGESRVASSVTVYNTILRERPDLMEVLTRDFYRSHTGEENPGDAPWFKQPIFSFTDGYFSAIGAGAAIDKALGIPGVPPHTPEQKMAIEFYRQVVEACAVDIPFAPGDVQFLNNFVTLHTRREYEDWPEYRNRRHLLRLWLSDQNGRPIPKEQRNGRSGRGVSIDGLKLTAPLDAEFVA